MEPPTPPTVKQQATGAAIGLAVGLVPMLVAIVVLQAAVPRWGAALGVPGWVLYGAVALAGVPFLLLGGRARPPVLAVALRMFGYILAAYGGLLGCAAFGRDNLGPDGVLWGMGIALAVLLAAGFSYDAIKRRKRQETPSHLLPRSERPGAAKGWTTQTIAGHRVHMRDIEQGHAACALLVADLPDLEPTFRLTVEKAGGRMSRPRAGQVALSAGWAVPGRLHVLSNDHGAAKAFLGSPAASAAAAKWASVAPRFLLVADRRLIVRLPASIDDDEAFAEATRVMEAFLHAARTSLPRTKAIQPPLRTPSWRGGGTLGETVVVMGGILGFCAVIGTGVALLPGGVGRDGPGLGIAVAAAAPMSFAIAALVVAYHPSLQLFFLGARGGSPRGAQRKALAWTATTGAAFLVGVALLAWQLAMA